MNIYDFRNFIEENDFRCMEIHDKANNEILFNFMTDKEDRHICTTYKEDKNGSLGFDSATIVIGVFENVCSAYIEAMLLCGQCSSIKHYRGDKVVELR